ncbi:MAG: outer membrane protein assembly factor BamB family protein [Promethearchaeota archaeon]
MPNTTAAETDKVTILMITNLGSDNTDNTIALSGDGNYIFAGTYDSLAANVTLIQVPDSFDADQDVIWKIDVGRGRHLEISSNASRLIYVDDTDASIVCLNPDSITPVWDFDLPAGTMGKADLSDNGDYLVYTYDDTITDHIVGVNAADNSPLWSFESDHNVMGLDVSNNGKFIVSLGNGTILYYDTEGYVWQSFQIGCVVPRLNEDGSRVLVSNQTGDESISLYDGSGTILWSFTDELLSNRGYDMARHTNEIIAVTYDSGVPLNNKMYSLNSSSGSPTWIINSGIRQQFARISANGKLAIVTDYEDNVYLIKMETGEVLMIHPGITDPRKIDIDNEGTIAAVLDINGNLIVYSITYGDDGETDDPTETDGFLDNFIGGFTNLDNIFSLGATLICGLLLGGLLFRKRKK